LRPTELCDRIDATRTTIQRILAGFHERTWVEKVDGRYRPTVTGRRIDERYGALRTTAERADRFAPLAKHVGELGAQLPSEAFETGQITAANDQDPLAAVDRIVEWLEASGGRHIQTTTPIVARSFNETVASLLEDDLRVDMVIDRGVLEQSAAVFETALERGQSHDQVSVSVVAEQLADGLMVRDDSAGIASYDETNNVRAVLVSEDKAVVSWAREQFEAIESRSRPLTDVLPEITIPDE
jgi:predicted transcriptional regulator